MKNEYIRELGEMPFDMIFTDVDGRQINCHATGYEVCLGNPDDPSDWWNEYVDSATDNVYYGR